MPLPALRPRVLLVLAFISAAFAAPITPPVDLGDLPRDQLPLHDWWQDASWADPGNWTTIDVAAHGLKPDDDTVDAAVVLNRLFKESSGNTLFQLAPGTYTLRSTLAFSRDGLRLRGAGRDRTTLRFTSGIKGSAITFNGRQSNDTGIVVSPAPKAGDRVIIVTSPDNLAPGAHLWFSVPEPKSFGQLARVASIDGNRVTLDRALSLDFPAAQPISVALLTPRRDCALENLRVDRRAEPRESTLNIAYGANILLRGLELDSTEFAHAYLWRAQEIFIEENVLHHSRHYGVGGSGYGVSFNAGTTRCLVRGNAMYYLRHATVFGGYACFNVVADNYLRSDQGHLDERHHGTFPFANLYEGNDTLAIIADSRADLNGPWNTHFRNRSTRIEAGPNSRNAVAPYFVVANLLSEKADGTFVALNHVAGQLVPGALPATSRLPASLYRSKTANARRFGPELPDFGASHRLPSEAWVPPVYRGPPESLVTINFAAATNAPPPTALPTSAKLLLPESLGASATAQIANAPAPDALRATSRVSPAGDKIRVMIENTSSAPQRVRFAYTAFPPSFGGVIRSVFKQGSLASLQTAADADAWHAQAETFYTDFSPREGHVVVLPAESVLHFELTNNTRRLSRY